MIAYLKGFVLWVVLGFSQTIYAQCDHLFADPEFGVENTWKPTVKGYAQEVSFKEACASRSSCYAADGGIKSRCDDQYLKDLTYIVMLF